MPFCSWSNILLSIVQCAGQKMAKPELYLSVVINKLGSFIEWFLKHFIFIRKQISKIWSFDGMLTIFSEYNPSRLQHNALSLNHFIHTNILCLITTVFSKYINFTVVHALTFCYFVIILLVWVGSNAHRRHNKS